MAAELRGAGFEVTENVGGTGVVALLKNGEGPTVMMRADMDGLPIEEKSGLSNASKKTATEPDNEKNRFHDACLRTGRTYYESGWYGAAHDRDERQVGRHADAHAHRTAERGMSDWRESNESAQAVGTIWPTRFRFSIPRIGESNCGSY